MLIYSYISLCFCGFLALPTMTHCQKNSFTVKDSIQMVHFSDPQWRASNPQVWKTSPDGSHVLLVTTKGIVASDEVESTLWTLDLRQIAVHLRNKASVAPPIPRRVFSVKGKLLANQFDSYGSLITDSLWALDSHSIYILTERGAGRRELDRVDATDGKISRLSHERYSVDSYALDSRGVLYSAARISVSHTRDHVCSPDVVETVRGSALYDLLWPSQDPKYFLFRSDTNGLRRLAPAPKPADRDSAFAMSPDGRRVITLVPVAETPVSWKAYLEGAPDLPLYRSGHSEFPVREYDLIDLHTHSRRPLLGSPSGSEVGYWDTPQVVWSPTGDHALVTNTFLPLEHGAQEKQDAQRRPCAAADVDVNTGTATCIVYARSSKQHESSDSWAVSKIMFGRTDHDVVVDLSWRGRHKTECYSSEHGGWAQNTTDPCNPAIEPQNRTSGPPVVLELSQGLNEPPSLWAKDVKTSRRDQIWNPNPQLVGKLSGQASVYRKRTWCPS